MVHIALLLVALSAGAAPPSAPSSLAADVGFIDPSQSPTWQRTLQRVVTSVVSLRVTATRDFDTEDASNSQGTGFVVDAERGIILTNRHMVHAGPVLAEAVFLDHEEVELQAIYRDPVHDFGFYRFDPSEVRHMELTELALVADAARVGLEVRVIGNDAGEKISILDGTLARLDRNAPDYGSSSYNDFNTFYLQAASNTSGGSSGSPVVDIHGDVVALNAGGKTRAASSFYLPLDRVVRALEIIREGEQPSRGTIQTVFTYTPFDELIRLGLPPDTESEARRSPAVRDGMLVVGEVVPGGPADGVLNPGDILVRANGELLADFVALEALLDDSIGESVEFEVQRGDETLPLSVEVGDLHAITPDEYVEVGRAIVHQLSYHQARNHNRPVQGMYVAQSGYMLAAAQVPASAIISHVDGVAVPDLDAFVAELETKAQGERIRIRFNMTGDLRHAYETVARMERRWYPMRRCVRDDDTGRWPCTESPPPPPLQPESPVSSVLPQAEGRVPSKLASSLVIVDFDISNPTAGVKDLNFVGVGTIVDAERGLVLVDRDTVPVALGDMMLTFHGSVRVPGELAYLHPVHNFAVIRYDPAAIGDTPVSAVEWADKPIAEGDTAWQVGLNRDYELVSAKTTVTSVEALSIGVSQTPRFRDANVAGVRLDEVKGSLGGVIVDKRGRVTALWASFLDQGDGERTFYGLPRDFILPALGPLLRDEVPEYNALGFELTPLNLAVARDRGLSDARVLQFIEIDPKGRQILEIERVHGGTPAREVLRDADLLLEVNGTPVTRMHEIERFYKRKVVTLTVLRDEREIEVELQTVPLEGTGVDRVVSWAGLLLHKPHYEVQSQQGIEPVGVYIAWLWYGSPGAKYGLRPTRRIIEVDDEPVGGLDEFLAAVAGRRDREPVRLTMERLDGSRHVTTLKLDLQYWPTQLLELHEGEWSRQMLDQPTERID